jgi:adenosine/AMP kinase
MPLGKVTVNALNQMQGAPTAVEKLFLYIGENTDAGIQNDVLYLNTDSDLDIELGVAASDLKTVISAARDNAGQNWNAIVVPVASIATWSAAVDIAINNAADFEAVVLVKHVSDDAELTAMQTKANTLLSAHAMRVFFITASLPMVILDAESTWSEYVAALSAITTGVVAPSVVIVPGFDGIHWLGILAGRLCNDTVSVADTPMRVKTGALVGVGKGDLPVDKDGVIYTNAYAKALNDLRFSVPQLYHGYQGVYWSDGTTLDEVIGDFKVIEYLRVINKAARLVYFKAVTMIGDRAFNDSYSGQAFAKNQLESAIHSMTLAAVVNNIPFPAEIRPLNNSSIVIEWVSLTEVKVWMTIRPYECPKDITVGIMLDLTPPTN